MTVAPRSLRAVACVFALFHQPPTPIRQAVPGRLFFRHVVVAGGFVFGLAPFAQPTSTLGSRTAPVPPNGPPPDSSPPPTPTASLPDRGWAASPAHASRKRAGVAPQTGDSDAGGGGPDEQQAAGRRRIDFQGAGTDDKVAGNFPPSPTSSCSGGPAALAGGRATTLGLFLIARGTTIHDAEVAKHRRWLSRHGHSAGTAVPATPASPTSAAAATTATAPPPPRVSEWLDPQLATRAPSDDEEDDEVVFHDGPDEGGDTFAADLDAYDRAPLSPARRRHHLRRHPQRDAPSTSAASGAGGLSGPASIGRRRGHSGRAPALTPAGEAASSSATSRDESPMQLGLLPATVPSANVVPPSGGARFHRARHHRRAARVRFSTPPRSSAGHPEDTSSSDEREEGADEVCGDAASAGASGVGPEGGSRAGGQPSSSGEGAGAGAGTGGGGSGGGDAGGSGGQSEGDSGQDEGTEGCGVDTRDQGWGDAADDSADLSGADIDDDGEEGDDDETDEAEGESWSEGDVGTADGDDEGGESIVGGGPPAAPAALSLSGQATGRVAGGPSDRRRREVAERPLLGDSDASQPSHRVKRSRAEAPASAAVCGHVARPRRSYTAM